MGFEFVKHCINDVKASLYKCYFLPVIIVREANALVKFVAPLRSFVVCCNNKNSLPDCVEEGREEWPYFYQKTKRLRRSLLFSITIIILINLTTFGFAFDLGDA